MHNGLQSLFSVGLFDGELQLSFAHHNFVAIFSPYC